MLLVKTKVAPSKIHGLGLFADEDITKGTLVWEFNPVIDKMISIQDFQSLPNLTQEYIKKYSYLEKGMYVLCGDNARFTNHSTNPNFDTLSKRPNVITARDIKKGEEITENYLTYDEI